MTNLPSPFIPPLTPSQDRHALGGRILLYGLAVVVAAGLIAWVAVEVSQLRRQERTDLAIGRTVDDSIAKRSAIKVEYEERRAWDEVERGHLTMRSAEDRYVESLRRAQAWQKAKEVEILWAHVERKYRDLGRVREKGGSAYELKLAIEDYAQAKERAFQTRKAPR